MCRLWFSCDVLFSTSSILHLFCVSVDRYLSISDEYSFYYTAEIPTKSWRVRIMIASVWILSALISSVPIFTDLFTTANHSAIIDNLDNEYGQCIFHVNEYYRTISSLISFWLPATGMIVFYTLVMKKANNMEKNKLKIYSSIKLSNQNLHENKSSMTSSQVLRSSSGRNSGEVIWKRKYKVKI